MHVQDDSNARSLSETTREETEREPGYEVDVGLSTRLNDLFGR